MQKCFIIDVESSPTHSVEQQSRATRKHTSQKRHRACTSSSERARDVSCALPKICARGLVCHMHVLHICSLFLSLRVLVCVRWVHVCGRIWVSYTHGRVRLHDRYHSRVFENHTNARNLVLIKNKFMCTPSI